MKKINRIIFLLAALVLFMGAFFIQAYASPHDGEKISFDSLAVSTAWLDAEMLRIDIFNERTDTRTSLAIRAADYFNGGEDSPFINIQAVDLDGNSSGVIQIRNPFYVPAAVSRESVQGNDEAASEPDTEVITVTDTVSYEPETQQPSRYQPLTPDGTGTVVDNVTDADGIEFFTIFTEDGNEFFLIVDRQRTDDNVYLLNTVTEEYLISLAHAGGREVAPVGSGFEASVPSPIHPNVPTDEVNKSADEEPPSEQPSATPTGNNNLILIVVIVLSVGGAGYYFKIHKKKNALAVNSYEEDEDDSFDDDAWNENSKGGGADDEE